MGRWSTPRPWRFIPGKDAVPVVQEAGWDPRTVWTESGKSCLRRIRSPDHPIHNESLYLLQSPCPRLWKIPPNFEPPQVSPFLNHMILRLRRMFQEIMVAAAEWTICWVVLWFAINCNPQNYVHRVLRKCMDGICLMRTLANISIGYTCSRLPASLNSRELHRLIRLPILGDLISFLFK